MLPAASPLKRRSLPDAAQATSATAHTTALASAEISTAEARTGTIALSLIAAAGAVAVFLTLDHGLQHVISLLLGEGTCGNKRFQAFLHPLQSGSFPLLQCGVGCACADFRRRGGD